MIAAEIVEAGITCRSTNIDRPSGPLWTSSCRSLEGKMITDSTNQTSLLFLDFVGDENVIGYPKVPVLPPNIRIGSGTPESRVPEPSGKPEEKFSRKGSWAC